MQIITDERGTPRFARYALSQQPENPSKYGLLDRRIILIEHILTKLQPRRQHRLRGRGAKGAGQIKIVGKEHFTNRTDSLRYRRFRQDTKSSCIWSLSGTRRRTFWVNGSWIPYRLVPVCIL